MSAKAIKRIAQRLGSFLWIFCVFFLATSACGRQDPISFSGSSTDGMLANSPEHHSPKAGVGGHSSRSRAEGSRVKYDLDTESVLTNTEQNLFQVPLEKSPRSGPDDAEVTAVLFGDFAGRDTAQVFDMLLEQRKRDGSFRWVYKFYPKGALDSPGMDACIAARYAADEGKFESFAKEVMSLDGKISRPSLVRIAVRLGLNGKSLLAALDDESMKKIVLADRRLAARLGVKMPPFIFLNGRPLELVFSRNVKKQFLKAVDDEAHRASLVLEKTTPGKPPYIVLTQHGRRSAWLKKIDMTGPRHHGYNHAYYSGDSSEKTYFVLPGPGPHLGSKHPKVTIVVFVSAVCSFCGSTLTALSRIARKHPRKLGVWIRHVPDSKKRPGPMAAAILLQALSYEPSYWKLAPKIMAGKVKFDTKSILDFVQRKGVDTGNLEKRLANKEKLEKQLSRNRAEAERLGVHSSPYLFINGKPLMGATNYKRLERMVEAEMKTPGFTATL